ncbi:helix-turn-helix transcriptional regulator [Oricola cellulosilytica]|uniref:Helix-turn-helix transcriptional regulator n=1 Tax=Oricola cellulosilytica TaxID=1429082 RepID=A0A4R0P5R9_9HYPH|nr:helix-turn-helix transcriptional regulator [Oricola cellulosilytica]TCD12275.1 helix-turn-helix transcriptional regulator [Oricola cellulosilytica]
MEAETARITNGLISAAYGAAVGDGSWEEFVGACGRAFPWSKTAFTLFDRDTRHCSTFSSANYEPGYLESWHAHYSCIDPWIEMSRGSGWTLRWSNETLSMRDLKKSEFYADWLRPQDDNCLGFAVNMHNGPGRNFMMLHMFRERDEPAAKQQYKVMRTVRPHLLRAYEIQRQVALERARTAGLETALDCMRHPVLMLDPDCRIIYANGSAEASMSEGSLFTSDATGRLAMRDSNNDAAVKGLARRLLRPRQVSDPPLLSLKSGDSGRFVCILAPFYSRDARLDLVRGTEIRPSGFILVILDLRRTPVEPGTVLAHLFGLTPAEARLVAALSGGATLRSYADRRRIRYETARNQLKTVLHKTASSRQSELMRVVSRVVDFEPGLTSREKR